MRRSSGILDVQLFHAKGLQNHDFFRKIDPYVLIQYRNQERRSRVATGQGRIPTWNEQVTVGAEYPAASADHHYKLVLRIMDKGTFSADDFLGQCTIYLEDLLAEGAENGKAEISPTFYRVVSADESYRGEIKVGITFTPHVENEEELGGWKQSSSDIWD